MSKPERNWPGTYAQPLQTTCPGYKRACGVTMPAERALCRFCTRTKELEASK